MKWLTNFSFFRPKALSREEIERISLLKSLFMQGAEGGVISEWQEFAELEIMLKERDKHVAGF